MIYRELIDTLWNVNVSWEESTRCLKRINRYIMECKWTPLVDEADSSIELIDTLWNVNY